MGDVLIVGVTEGNGEGWSLGFDDGCALGEAEGEDVGIKEGSADGVAIGPLVD